MPYAIVWNDPGESWTLTADHELLEMLADPYVDRVARASDGRLYIVEVCDPVEDTRFSYTKPGADGRPVTLSDFVGPAWYAGGSRYLDLRRHVKRPQQILYGGYATYWDGTDWVPVFG